MKQLIPALLTLLSLPGLGKLKAALTKVLNLMDHGQSAAKHDLMRIACTARNHFAAHPELLQPVSYELLKTFEYDVQSRLLPECVRKGNMGGFAGIGFLHPILDLVFQDEAIRVIAQADDQYCFFDNICHCIAEIGSKELFYSAQDLRGPIARATAKRLQERKGHECVSAV